MNNPFAREGALTAARVLFSPCQALDQRREQAPHPGHVVAPRSAFNSRQTLSNSPIDELVSGILVDHASVIGGAQLLNVIEYGRCVHAEMAAIVDAARRGVAIAGCTLYTTTFPCHECARHIVAASIRQVVYIDPYPKS